MRTERIERVRKLVYSLLDEAGLDSPASSLMHIESVARISYLLAERRGIEKSELAYIAGLLHDVYAIVTGEREKHAEKGSLLATSILNTLALFTFSECQIITEAIRNHSSKKRSDDEYSEVLKDADALDHYLSSSIISAKDRERIEKAFFELTEKSPCL